MNKRLHYLRFFIRNAPSTIFCALVHKPKQTKRFRGVKGINVEKSGMFLREKILSGQPFCAIRFGGSEISCLNNYEKIQLGFRKTYKESVRWAMKVRAGFYPTDDQHLDDYSRKFEKEAGFADILAISGLHMEDYFAEKLTPKAKIISNWAMEPLLGRWTSALKGKKVLVVSPFAKEILSQYAKRDKIFPADSDILPEFELTVLEAPKTLGEETAFAKPSFMDSLRTLEEEIAKVSFDIALIGAGAYGSLLCFYCRSLGRSAIQSGGATQTLFGILGKRWENRPHVVKWVNQYWIRPENKPLGYEKIDNGAYW